MIATFFEWRVKQGQEGTFREAWNRATLYFLERGSNGSSLWRSEAGHFCALALWPDCATREAAFAGFDLHPDMRIMSDAVTESVQRIELDPLDNHWRLASAGQSTEI